MLPPHEGAHRGHKPHRLLTSVTTAGTTNISATKGPTEPRAEMAFSPDQFAAHSRGGQQPPPQDSPPRLYTTAGTLVKEAPMIDATPARCSEPSTGPRRAPPPRPGPQGQQGQPWQQPKRPGGTALVLLPPSLLAALPLHPKAKEGLAANYSMQQPAAGQGAPSYSPLHQNEDRAISPLTNDDILALQTLGVPVAPSSRPAEEVQTGLAISIDSSKLGDENMDVACRDDDEGADAALCKLTVRALYNLASYSNPNQLRAQKALLRARLAHGTPTTTTATTSTAERHNEPFSPPSLTDASPDMVHHGRRNTDQQSENPSREPQQQYHYRFDPPGQANSHYVGGRNGTRPRPGAPEPLKAGPPGRRQYRPSNFNPNAKVFTPTPRMVTESDHEFAELSDAIAKMRMEEYGTTEPQPTPSMCHRMPISGPAVQMPPMQAPGIPTPMLQAPNMQVPGMQTSSNQAPNMQIPGMQTSSNQAPNTQTLAIQSPNTHDSRLKTSSMHTSGMQASRIQASHIEASHRQASGVQPSGMPSPIIQRPGIQGLGIRPPTRHMPSGPGPFVPPLKPQNSFTHGAFAGHTPVSQMTFHPAPLQAPFQSHFQQVPSVQAHFAQGQHGQHVFGHHQIQQVQAAALGPVGPRPVEMRQPSSYRLSGAANPSLASPPFGITPPPGFNASRPTESHSPVYGTPTHLVSAQNRGMHPAPAQPGPFQISGHHDQYLTAEHPMLAQPAPIRTLDPALPIQEQRFRDFSSRNKLPPMGASPRQLPPDPGMKAPQKKIWDTRTKEQVMKYYPNGTPDNFFSDPEETKLPPPWETKPIRTPDDMARGNQEIDRMWFASTMKKPEAPLNPPTKERLEEIHAKLMREAEDFERRMKPKIRVFTSAEDDDDYFARLDGCDGSGPQSMN